MLTKEFLEKIGFCSEDALNLAELCEEHRASIETLVSEYMSGRAFDAFVPYDGEARERSRERADEFVKSAQDALCDENGYVASLVAWLLCIEYLHGEYKNLGICDDVFYESMKDFSYKAKECKTLHGVCGVFVNWFFLFFDLKEVALGRLQYEASVFEYDKYVFGDVKLSHGDTVYSCHIPSSGKLTCELCLDSLQKAYEFFKPKLAGDILPVVCHSWLLYPPYVEKVFPDGSNLSGFAKMFDVISENEDPDFYDSWRVFDKSYAGDVAELPVDNTLRRNFIKYIKGGGDFGEGYGVILYDGKKREIINGGIDYEHGCYRQH